MVFDPDELYGNSTLPPDGDSHLEKIKGIHLRIPRFEYVSFLVSVVFRWWKLISISNVISKANWLWIRL